MEKQTDRIRRYEKLLNEATRVHAEYEAALARFAALADTVAALDEYSRSKAWRRDFAASEAGRLPEDLPCGVLSEDGLYNVLEEDAALLSETETVLQKRRAAAKE